MGEQSLLLPKEGDRVGSGIILGLVNVGGTARVYKTWVETLELYRAVKVLNPDSNEEARANFATEARIASRLIHPNIVQIHNFGETEGGLPYIEMELVGGLTLEHVLRQNRAMPLPVAVAAVMGVLEAVHYAHTLTYTLYDQSQNGIIHRDIKPSNVIFSGGIPKLMDFGMASPVAISRHTNPGNVPGTMPYMPPEVCAGKEGDSRSDVYQIGLLLYECICGELAFPQLNLAALCEAIKVGRYKPLDPETNGKAAAIVKKCLRVDPAKRYQTVQECLADVRNLYNAISPNMPPEARIRSYLKNPGAGDGETYGDKYKTHKLIGICAAAVLLLWFGIFVAAPSIMRSVVLDYVIAQAAMTSAPVPAPDEKMPVDSAEITPKTDTQTIAAVPVEEPPPDSAEKVLQIAAAEQARDSAMSEPKVQPAGGGGGQTEARQRQIRQKSAELPAEDALTFIENGKLLMAQNKPAEALAIFQKARQMNSPTMPKDEIVRQTVHWAAMCNTVLLKDGNVSRAAYDAAWQNVQSVFTSDSREYREAARRLNDPAP